MSPVTKIEDFIEGLVKMRGIDKVHDPKIAVLSLNLCKKNAKYCIFNKIF
jgi:hypothetical protein